MNPVEVQNSLVSAANQLDNASTELAKAIEEFEGHLDEDTAEWRPGPKFIVESLVADESVRIFTDYEENDKRPPRQDICEARARAKVKRDHPDEWADYERLSSRIGALQKWIGSKKESISARQSVLSAEKKLMELA